MEGYQVENITKEFADVKDKADIIKGLSHPIRLCIVKGLMSDEGCNVSKMQDSLDIPQSTLSQHLAKLRNLGILEGQRNRVEVNYYVVSEDAKKIIKALF
mgnify:FL=1